jgi:hypothetical protein
VGRLAQILKRFDDERIEMKLDEHNEAARLRREADTHARDADRINCEARGMEASATMIRVSLGVALSNVPVIAES